MKYKLRKEFSQDPDRALLDILTERGVKNLYAFLNPSFEECELNPYDLENIDAAADMLLRHLKKDSNILFLVDCDADGFTSSAVLWLYIKNIYPAANLNFTVHEHKQHGLNDRIDWIEDNPDFDLVIAPDASSYDIEEHERLADLGIDVLVLDHHSQEFDKDGNPITSNSKNTIVVNNQLSPKYSNKSLCGAGVVYKFCEVLDNKLGIKQAQSYLDLVALGEIADVMNRTNSETNYLMMEGLSHIHNKGFQTLLEAQSYSLKERAVAPWTGLTTIDIAFYIAPLINAITRVGTIDEKRAMFYCFIEPDKRVPSTKRGAREGDTESAAEQTARVGKNCKAKQDRIKEKALDLIDFKIQKDGLDENNIIFVEIDRQDGIPQELTGLIAMAVVSKYRKPVMLGRKNDNGDVQGSIRSDNNFAGLPSFKKFLEDSKLTNYVAGHDGAAGFSITDNRVNQLLDFANKQLRAEDFENCYLVDYILDGAKDNDKLLNMIAESGKYFGNQIDEIKIVIENISLGNITIMGADKDSIKIVYNGISYVCFKNTDFIEDIQNNRFKKLVVFGHPQINEWMGHKSVQVIISDYDLIDDVHRYDF